MSKYLINGESIEAIADGFRTSRGTEQKYTLDEMAVLAAEKVGGGEDFGWLHLVTVEFPTFSTEVTAYKEEE